VAQNKTAIAFKAMSNGDIKLNVANENDYRQISSLLREIRNGQQECPNNPNIEYHSYKIKSDRKYTFIIRGLPASTDPNDIKEGIEEEGHTVVSVTNLMKKITKNGVKSFHKFPLFRVEIEPAENNKNVFKLQSLAYCKITVEAPCKTKTIPQCLRCQQLGHTKNFCSRDPKCVKCAGGHLSQDCRKNQRAKPSCVLCGAHGEDGHPANYKGCPAYQAKLQATQPKALPVVERLRQQPLPNKLVNLNQSYANVAKNTVAPMQQKISPPQASPVTQEPTIGDLMTMLLQFQYTFKTEFDHLNERVSQLEKLPSYKQK